MDNVELKELMESWARQKVVCEQALATLSNLETAVAAEFGERERPLYSEHTIVYTKQGNKRWNWEQAVYDAHVPVERITPHSTIKTNFRKVCEAEGIEKEDVSFTQGDPKIVVELSLSDTEKAAALPVDNPPSNKMFK
jgi:hypothetical protein